MKPTVPKKHTARLRASRLLWFVFDPRGECCNATGWYFAKDAVAQARFGYGDTWPGLKAQGFRCVRARIVPDVQKKRGKRA